MAKHRKANRGRPPNKGEFGEKSEVAHFRIRPDTKRLLEEAARRNSHTASYEFEYQLRRALADMGTGPTFAIMRVIGKAVDDLVNLKDPQANWLNDPYLFAEATRAMNAMLNFYRPPGDVPESTAELGPRRQGELQIEQLLHAIQTVDMAKPYRKRSPRERELSMLRGDLGDLADRPHVHGYTAEQARRVHDLLRQFVPLRRKPESVLSAKEREQMIALWQQIEVIRAGAEK